MNSLCAIIVSYNGEDIIKNNIHNIKDEVDKIIIIDNGSNEFTVKSLKTIYDDKIDIIYLNKNKGIAYALNKGLEYAIENKFKWIITFDQDTIPVKNSIVKLLEHAEKYNLKSRKNISFGVQLVLNNNIRSINKKSKRGCKKVPYLITSGNITLVEAAKEVNGWTNELFIDSVDYDFSLKLRKKGYKLIRCYDCVMNHSLGERIEGKKYSVHSDFRKYYMIRNEKYILKKYFLIFPFYCFFNFSMFSLGVIRWFIYEQDRKQILKIIKRALKDKVEI